MHIHKKRLRFFTVLILLSIFNCNYCVQVRAADALTNKAVIFLLDASNSMNANDKNTSLCTTTTMPKEITGFTNNIKNIINQKNFGWVFASENAALDGQNIAQITVYKARNLLYDPDRSTYEPAYRTQVTTYIERILRHASGDFKQDNIVQFFSNNPTSPGGITPRQSCGAMWFPHC